MKSARGVLRAVGSAAFGLLDTAMSAYQQYLLVRERTRKAENIKRLEEDALAVRKASRW